VTCPVPGSWVSLSTDKVLETGGALAKLVVGLSCALLAVDRVQLQEEKAAKVAAEAALQGKDAFEELKKMAASASATAPPPAPPAPPVDRPTIVPNPIKNGGFVSASGSPWGTARWRSASRTGGKSWPRGTTRAS